MIVPSDRVQPLPPLAPSCRMTFRGKPPGSGSGEMSQRTAALRPTIALAPDQAAKARALRRKGLDPEAIAERFAVPVEEVEKALVQMRSRRPETTRGTLNVTLAAHRLVLSERQGDEPLWQTMDQLLDELLRLRALAGPRRPRKAKAAGEPLPGLLE